jgi:hypothetical protein
LVVLEFYRESVVRRVVDDQGRQSLALVDPGRGCVGARWRAASCRGDETGPNCLFWARSHGSTRLRILVGPRLWRLMLRSREPGGKDRRLRLPFPGLLFIARPDAQLFHCPSVSTWSIDGSPGQLSERLVESARVAAEEP